MICPSCGQEDPPGFRHCGMCGALTLLDRSKTTFGLMRLSLAADALGVRAELPRLVASRPDLPWISAAAAALDGEFERAADIVGEHAWRVDEAELRLRAAEALVEAGRRPEADVQLQRALAFYRSVGATRFIREGEALLAATA